MDEEDSTGVPGQRESTIQDERPAVTDVAIIESANEVLSEPERSDVPSEDRVQPDMEIVPEVVPEKAELVDEMVSEDGKQTEGDDFSLSVQDEQLNNEDNVQPDAEMLSEAISREPEYPDELVSESAEQIEEDNFSLSVQKEPLNVVTGDVEEQRNEVSESKIGDIEENEAETIFEQPQGSVDKIIDQVGSDTDISSDNTVSMPSKSLSNPGELPIAEPDLPPTQAEEGEATALEQINQEEAVILESGEGSIKKVAVSESNETPILGTLPDSNITMAQSDTVLNEDIELTPVLTVGSTPTTVEPMGSTAVEIENKKIVATGASGCIEITDSVPMVNQEESAATLEELSSDTAKTPSGAALQPTGLDGDNAQGTELYNADAGAVGVQVEHETGQEMEVSVNEPELNQGEPTATQSQQEDTVMETSLEHSSTNSSSTVTNTETVEPEHIVEMIVSSPVTSPSKRLRMPDHNYEKKEDASPELAAQSTKLLPQPVIEPIITKEKAFICGKSEVENSFVPKMEQMQNTGILPEVAQYSYPNLMQNITTPEGVIPEEIFEKHEEKGKGEAQIQYQDVHTAQVYGNQLVTSDGQILTVINTGQDESVEAIQAFIQEGSEWTFDQQVIQMSNQHGIAGDGMATQDGIQGQGFYVPAELLQGNTEQAVSLFEVRMPDGSTQYLQIPVTVPVQKSAAPPTEVLPTSLPSAAERQTPHRTHIDHPKPAPVQRQYPEGQIRGKHQFAQDGVQRHYAEDGASLSQLVSSSMEAVDFGSDAGGSYILSHAQHVLSQCVEEKPKVPHAQEVPQAASDQKEAEDELSKQKKQTLEQRVSRLLKGNPGTEPGTSESDQSRPESSTVGVVSRSDSRLSAGGQGSPARGSPVLNKDGKSTTVTLPKALMKNMFSESHRIAFQESKKPVTKVIDGVVIHNYQCEPRDVRQMSSKKIDLNPSLEAFSIDAISKVKPASKTAQTPSKPQKTPEPEHVQVTRIALPLPEPSIDLPQQTKAVQKPIKKEPVRHILKIAQSPEPKPPKRTVMTKVIGGQVIHNIGCDPSDPRMFSMKKVDLPPCLETFSLDEPPPQPKKRQPVAIPSRRVFPSNPPEKRIMHTRVSLIPPGCIDLVDQPRIDHVQMKLPFEQEDDLDLDINLFEPLSANAVPLMRRMLQNQAVKQEEKPKPIFASNRLLTPVAVKTEKKYIYTDESGKQYEIPASRNVQCFESTPKATYTYAKKEPDYVLPETVQYFEEQPQSIVEESVIIAHHQSEPQTEEYYYAEDGSLVVAQPQGQPETFIGEDGLYYYQNEQYFFTPETLGLGQGEHGDQQMIVHEGLSEQVRLEETTDCKVAYYPQADILDLDSVRKQKEAEMNDEDEFVIVQPRAQPTAVKSAPVTPRDVLKPQTYTRIKTEPKSANVPSPLHILKAKKNIAVRRSLPEDKAGTCAVKQSVSTPKAAPAKRITLPFRVGRPEPEETKIETSEEETKGKIVFTKPNSQQLAANPVRITAVTTKSSTPASLQSSVKSTSAAPTSKAVTLTTARSISLPTPPAKCISLPPPLANMTKSSTLPASPTKNTGLTPGKSINLPSTAKSIDLPHNNIPGKGTELASPIARSATLSPSVAKTPVSLKPEDSKQVKIRIVAASTASASPNIANVPVPVNSKAVAIVAQAVASPSKAGILKSLPVEKPQVPSTENAVRPKPSIEVVPVTTPKVTPPEASKTIRQVDSQSQASPVKSVPKTTKVPDPDLNSPPVLSPEKLGQSEPSSDTPLPTLLKVEDVATPDGNDDDLPPVLEPVNPNVKPIIDEWDSEDEKPLKPKKPVFKKTYDRRKSGEADGASVEPQAATSDAQKAAAEKLQIQPASAKILAKSTPEVKIAPKPGPAAEVKITTKPAPAAEIKITPKPVPATEVKTTRTSVSTSDVKTTPKSALKSPSSVESQVPIVSVSPGPGGKQVRFAASPIKSTKDATPMTVVPTPKRPAIKTHKPDSEKTPEKPSAEAKITAASPAKKTESPSPQKIDSKVASPSKVEKPVVKTVEKTPAKTAEKPVKSDSPKLNEKVAPSRKRLATPVDADDAKRAKPAPRKSLENGRKLKSPEGRNLKSPDASKLQGKGSDESPSKVKEFDIFSTPTMKHKRVSFSETEEIISHEEEKTSPPVEKRASRSRDSKSILKPKTLGKRPSDGASEQPERKRRKPKSVVVKSEEDESDDEDFLSGADMGAMPDRLPGVSSKPCPICSVRYTTAEGLANHIATHNGFINNKKICPLCTYSVPESKRSKAQIQSHILTSHRILLPDAESGATKTGKSSD